MAKAKDKTGAPPSAKKNGKTGRKYWIALALVWGLNLAWSLLPISPEIVEHLFTRGIYRVTVSLLTPMTSPIPFPLTLLLIAALLVGFPLIWYWRGRRLVRKHGASRFRALLLGPKWLLLLLPLLNLWFLAFWGAGYMRPPVEARLELNLEKIQPEEATALRERLFEMILRDQPRSPEDRNVDRALATIAASMREVIAEWDGVPVRIPDNVKRTPKGMLMLNGTSGVCSPFTLEPNVDGGLPDANMVAVAAHEIGHVAGICSEAEANLISYVSGVRAADPFARYSVALRLYTSFAQQLPREQMIAAMQRLPQCAKEDLKAAADAHKRYKINLVEKYSWLLYDKYLKKQGIEEGVKNYARGTALFVLCWRKGLVQFAGPVGDGAPAE